MAESTAEALGKKTGEIAQSTGAWLADAASAVADNVSALSKTIADGAPKFWEKNGVGGTAGALLAALLAYGVGFGALGEFPILPWVLTAALTVLVVPAGASFGRETIAPFLARNGLDGNAKGEQPEHQHSQAPQIAPDGQNLSFAEQLYKQPGFPKQLAFNNASSIVGATHVPLENVLPAQYFPADRLPPPSRNL